MQSKGLIVAIIDDDKIFQLTASKTIMLTGISEEVLQFENAEDGLRYLKEKSAEPEKLPDYIFLDINMPLMDGWMFLEDYALVKSSLRKDITIFMVSSSIDPRDIQRATSTGEVKQYVVKPVTREKFADLLRVA